LFVVSKLTFFIVFEDTNTIIVHENTANVKEKQNICFQFMKIQQKTNGNISIMQGEKSLAEL